jgi:hypothetical protein
VVIFVDEEVAILVEANILEEREDGSAEVDESRRGAPGWRSTRDLASG